MRRVQATISTKVYILAFIFLFFFVVPLARDAVFKDPLIYEHREEMFRVWSPATGEDNKSLLENNDQGIVLSDLSGDCYGDENSQRAVFLRTPRRPTETYLQVKISNFIPLDTYTQAGMVLWHDADNYIRHTIGFVPAAHEALGEFQGNPGSRGLFPLYPRQFPTEVWLRFDVRRRTVKCWISYNGAFWYSNGGFTLPKDIATTALIKGAGIIGVGGRTVQKPLFSDWEEGDLLPYADDDFNRNLLAPNWTISQTNSGWGHEKTRIYLSDGHLVIKPFSGSDIYLGNETYPFAAIHAPEGDEWIVEIKISRLNTNARGRFNKAGVVLSQDNGHFINLALVCDELNDQIYFETLSYGDRNHFFREVNVEGFAARKITDAYLRIRKRGADKFHTKASYDNVTWYDLGEYENPLYEPDIRLFASGDIYMQYTEEYDFAAQFDYIKKFP